MFTPTLLRPGFDISVGRGIHDNVGNHRARTHVSSRFSRNSIESAADAERTMIDMTTWRWYVSEIFRAQKGSQATVASTRSNPASKLSPDAEVVVGCADDVVMTKNTRV